MFFCSWKKSVSPKIKVTESPSGLLLLYKPAGVTSFDCVQVAKRRLEAAKVGHCGTLDPAARGLLLLLVGTSTREQESFLALEKQYWFKARFGVKTSTGDREGEIIEERPYDPVTSDTLENVLKDFVGPLQQMPPLYSALKYKGKPYYHYARKGLDVPRQARAVTISALSLLSFALPEWEARLVCSRGTYVRTLIEDISERLGTCGTMLDLVRERIGPYEIGQALSWDDLRTKDTAALRAALHPVSLETAALHA
jgi:tRNA pseudouridine55 synthase